MTGVVAGVLLHGPRPLDLLDKNNGTAEEEHAMMPKTVTLSAIAVLSLGLLAGCGDVTLYEPGVYKGSGDATASAEAAERRAGDLGDRARAAYTDR